MDVEARNRDLRERKRKGFVESPVVRFFFELSNPYTRDSTSEVLLTSVAALTDVVEKTKSEFFEGLLETMAASRETDFAQTVNGNFGFGKSDFAEFFDHVRDGELRDASSEAAWRYVAFLDAVRVPISNTAYVGAVGRACASSALNPQTSADDLCRLYDWYAMRESEGDAAAEDHAAANRAVAARAWCPSCPAARPPVVITSASALPPGSEEIANYPENRYRIFTGHLAPLWRATAPSVDPPRGLFDWRLLKVRVAASGERPRGKWRRRSRGREDERELERRFTSGTVRCSSQSDLVATVERVKVAGAALGYRLVHDGRERDRRALYFARARKTGAET